MQVQGSVQLEVVHCRRGWQVVVRTNYGFGSEVVNFGRCYATREEAYGSLRAHMRKLVEVLENLGLEHGEPEAFA
jgi:hypothetical protein